VNRFQREHDISHILQRSLLPTVLPELPGVRLAARYLPATVDAEVGGDWYDVIADGHKIAFVVGDVEGHDMNAATVMGTLRNALNAFLGETYDPQDALVRLNRFARRSHLSKLATALVVVVDLATAELTAASAGHLPPILRGAGGAAFIEVRPAPPLGLDWDHVDQSRLRLPTASADLVLYTDGLVERPGFSLEARFAELIDAVNSGLPSGEHMCDQILETMLPSVRTDDIAILTVAITLVDQAPDASGDAD
jgi:serine/threonine-protein kinase RsbW